MQRENGSERSAQKPDTAKECIPDNEQLAKGRFRSLAKRLATDDDLRNKYATIIADQYKADIIETVSDETVSHAVHYIPHQPVITPQKTTTKVRIVFDASARANKQSKGLNDCLYRGPVILEVCRNFSLARMRMADVRIKRVNEE